MTRKKKGRVGSSFDDFLAEQGILEECEEQAVKQILADQIKAAMEKDRLTKAAMAIRMQTSRRALDRLLDPTKHECYIAHSSTRCCGYRPPTPAGTHLTWRQSTIVITQTPKN